MPESIKQKLMELASKLNVSLEYLLKHLEDDLNYPIN